MPAASQQRERNQVKVVQTPDNSQPTSAADLPPPIDVAEHLATEGSVLFSAVLNNLRAACVIIEKTTGSIVFRNASAKMLLAQSVGVESVETLADLIEIIATHNDVSTVRAIKGAIKTQVGHLFDDEGTSLMIAGIPYAVRVIPHEVHQKGNFVTVICRDISAQKSLEMAQNDLISVVSHELRSPLASIRGALQLLSSGALGGLTPEARKVFDIAARNSEHMLNVVNEILEEQSQKHNKVTKREAIDLCGLIRDAIDAQIGFAAQWNSAFVQKADHPRAYTAGDRQKLLQVLSNLMTNAVKFSPSGSKIQLALVDKGDRWRIEVTDEGPGISGDQEKRLFKRFETNPTEGEEKLASSGLGLSISKEIVDNHGGTIGFRNAEPTGATFFFDLQKVADPDSN